MVVRRRTEGVCGLSMWRAPVGRTGTKRKHLSETGQRGQDSFLCLCYSLDVSMVGLFSAEQECPTQDQIVLGYNRLVGATYAADLVRF